jgi:hypothetical protein
MSHSLRFCTVNALNSVEEDNVFQNCKTQKENVLLRTDTNRPASFLCIIHDRMALEEKKDIKRKRMKTKLVPRLQ